MFLAMFPAHARYGTTRKPSIFLQCRLLHFKSFSNELQLNLKHSIATGVFKYIDFYLVPFRQIPTVRFSQGDQSPEPQLLVGTYIYELGTRQVQTT